ncbi:androgen-induced gene 1 protein-like [Thamnophis elegans]|uniref:androgen-induced gene 1 protein-like n=1 Tax=Thamnophis elegans TaxID=35005 RepID=UPI0013779B7A|nr:androgen-induced gene 1 protein-like [Thamnophis elegans]
MRLTVRGQRAVALLHFICLLWATFAMTQNLGLPRSVRKVHDDSYGGQWKYLTFLNQLLQTVLYLLCFTIDAVALFVPSQEEKVSSTVVPVRDFIFSAYVFPVGLFVPVAFWGLYAIDRELVYPKELDDINPNWLNHSMHTTILPLLFIELVICPHKYPPRRKGLLGLGIFVVVYLSWIFWIHHVSGIWAYPVLGVLGLLGKAVFIVIAMSIMLTFYFLGERLTKWLWAKH